MATGKWQRLGFTTWHIRLKSSVDYLRDITGETRGHAGKLLQLGALITGVLLLLLTVSVIWEGFLVCAFGVTLVLFLQEIVDPTHLFWGAPWEAIQLVLSRSVRVNHLWLHRTQELLREPPAFCGKLDGFATRDGFVLAGTRLTEAEIHWASELSLCMVREGSRKGPIKGCKTARFLLVFWLLAGGLLVLSAWRGEVDLGSAVLLSAVCGAAGQGLAGPAESFLRRWVTQVSFSGENVWPDGLEVEFLTVAPFSWSESGHVFRVRQVYRRKKMS